MLFAARSFTLAKDPDRPGEFQDALRFDAEGGTVAVADGVASAIFSAQWAELLVESAVAAPPEPDDHDAFAAWLKARRQQWHERIDTTGLAWFQRAKLPLGAFSTLLCARIAPADAGFRLRAWAIGDTCLLHVRGGRLLRVFPIERAADFAADPVVLGSIDLNRDHLLRFAAIEADCATDDLLVFCTDAVAEWILRQIEADNPPVWDDFWKMTDAEWRDGLGQLRVQGLMRYDDATLLAVRVGAEAAAALPAIELPPPAAAAPAAPVPAAQDPAAEAAEPVVPAIVAEPAEPAVAEPILLPDDDWKGKLKTAGDKVSQEIDKAGNQLMRGLRTLGSKLAKFYHENVRPEKKPPEKHED